jgi:ATP-dependent Lon protease
MKRILEPLLDRFEAYHLTDYTDDQFRAIAAKRLKQEGIENEELDRLSQTQYSGALEENHFEMPLELPESQKQFKM